MNEQEVAAVIEDLWRSGKSAPHIVLIAVIQENITPRIRELLSAEEQNRISIREKAELSNLLVDALADNTTGRIIHVAKQLNLQIVVQKNWLQRIFNL